MKSPLNDKKVSFRCKPSLINAAVRSSIFVLGLAHGSAHAADIAVNSASDNGVGCTLREAINSANTSLDQGNGCATGSDSDVDRILFDSTGFATATSIQLGNGQLELQNKNIEIDAQSVTGGVTLMADSATRVMQVSGGDVSLNNLTITGGRAVDSGGGLLINDGAVVTLTDSQVSDNTVTESGGGIHLDGESTLSLQSSTVTTNRADQNQSTFGGAIYAGNGNTIELQDSEISENTIRSASGRFSAGIFARENNTVRVINSSISNNAASAIEIRGGSSLDLIDSVIENNADGSSAALELLGAGVVNITRSRIVGNEGFLTSAALSIDGKTTTIVDSVISNNSTANGLLGGAFNFDNGRFIVTNTTISNNKITNDNAAYAAGGSIGMGADVTFNHVTMSDNNVYSNRGFGTSLLVLGGTLNLQNSIIANSVGPSDISCSVPIGTVTIDSATIIEDGSCGAARNGDPGLLPLNNNGGPTQTNALNQGSIAINTGDTTTCLQTDQRGGERDVLCDVGAFEFGADVPGDTLDNEPQTFLIPLPNGKVVIFDL